ncbi:MAG: Gfo/Idh/MocA family oxidoreductase [Sediminibacterium sp.]|nr:Gfo/Idh/MocA family oxidoreductase [Sediminibacterium sp.]
MNLPDNKEKFNVALLSFGLSGRVFHAPFIQHHPDLNLFGCWERSEKKIKNFYPNCQSFSSLEEILQHPEIDIVVVNTPTVTHFEYTKKSLEHHKHVVVEKCFTSTVAEALALKSILSNTSLTLSIYQNRRFDNDFLTLQHYLKTHDTGNIIQAELRFERWKPIKGPKLHKEIPSEGAGIFKDLAPHVLDQVLILFGMPNKVWAQFQKLRPGSLVEDHIFSLLIYENFTVSITISLWSQFDAPAYKIQTQKTTLIKFRSDNQEAQLNQGLFHDDPQWQQDQSFLDVYSYNEKFEIEASRFPVIQGSYMSFYEDFVQALKLGRPPIMNIDHGIKIMTLIESIENSAKEHSLVTLN